MRIVIYLLFVVFFGGCSESRKLLVFSGSTMGTTYNISLVKKLDFVDIASIKLAVESRLHKINSIFSTYIATSQVSVFNKLKRNQKLTVTKEFLRLLQQAKNIYVKTNGAYDLTVMPLVTLWGFANQERAKGLLKAIKKDSYAKFIAKKKIVNGMNFIKRKANQIWKTNSNIKLDFSSIAKGYAVDEVAEVLKKFSQKDYFVEIGGEIKVSGVNHKASQWRLGIEAPKILSIVNNRSLFAITSLKDVAMATSGNYRNFTFINDKQYSHIIDGETKFPVSNSLLSVSVVAKNCSKADAWATAFMVLGLKKSMVIAQKNNIQVLLVYKKAKKIEYFKSKKFPKIEKIMDK